MIKYIYYQGYYIYYKQMNNVFYWINKFPFFYIFFGNKYFFMI